MLAATRDAGREPSERDAAAAAAWAALAAENDRLRRENAQLRRARPKVPRALTQLAPYNTPGPRSAATPTTSALVAPRRRKLLAAHPSAFVSSDDESAPNVAALPEVGAALADPGLLYKKMSEAEVLASKDDAEQNRGKSLPRRKELTSRFTGVWQPDREDKSKWRAAISVRGSRIPLGEFDDEEDAARVYDAAVVKYRGEPTVNFPGEVPRAEVLAALPPPPEGEDPARALASDPGASHALYQRARAPASSLPVAWQRAGLTERPRDPPSAPRPAAPPVLGERPPSHVLLQGNEQGELPSEDEDEASTRLRSKPRDPQRLSTAAEPVRSGVTRCTSGRPNCYCKTGRTRPIVRYDLETGEDLEEYCSTLDAERKLKVTSIGNVLIGRARTTGGHAFRYKAAPSSSRSGDLSQRPKKSQPPCHAGLTTSLHIALADERWNALEKWTFAHAADPYPSAEDKAALARKAGLPPGTVQHWFSNMRKRKYLKLRDGTRAPRGAFEAQLYQFMPIAPATDADEGGQEDADVNAALPEAAPAPSPTEEPAGDAAVPDAAGSEYSDDDDDDDEVEEEDDGGEWSPDTPVVQQKKKKKKKAQLKAQLSTAPSAAAFPRKLLDLVEDTDVPEISWDDDGTGVSVQKGPAVDRVLGDRFATTKGWDSLLRQLNWYGFTRSSREGNTVVYENAAFTRTSTPAQIADDPSTADEEAAATQSSLPAAWQKAGLTERPRDPHSARQATGTPAVEAPLYQRERAAAAPTIVPGATADVNPKQSGRIMKRRQARLKFATMDKVSQARADHAHESRCRRARKRKRDATGHFAARKKAAGAPLHDLDDEEE